MSILRDHTAMRHREAEARPFVQYLLNGGISQAHYVKFLQQMYPVYSNIEYFAELSGLLHDLPDIKRADRIRQDLEEFDERVNVPLLPATQRYRQRIIDLYWTQQRPKILAHVYVRHMGDLYGGKIIAQRVPGSGQAYGFEDRPGLIKALDARLSLDLVDEALISFELSMGVFDELWREMQS